MLTSAVCFALFCILPVEKALFGQKRSKKIKACLKSECFADHSVGKHCIAKGAHELKKLLVPSSLCDLHTKLRFIFLGMPK